MSEVNKALTHFIVQPHGSPAGVSGRVRALCPDGQQDANACHDIQAEIMDADGNYVPVYNPEALKRNSKIEEGDDVYLSPEFFLSVSNTCSIFPGQIYPYIAELPKKKELLSPKALVELCYDRIITNSEDVSLNHSFAACVRQAKSDPEDHSFQPSQSPHLQDPGQIYFDASPDGKGYYGLPRQYLLKGGENVVTPEAKAVLEEFSRKYLDDAGYFTIVRAKRFQEKLPQKDRLMQMLKNRWPTNENTPQKKREDMGRRPMRDRMENYGLPTLEPF